MDFPGRSQCQAIAKRVQKLGFSAAVIKRAQTLHLTMETTSKTPQQKPKPKQASAPAAASGVKTQATYWFSRIFLPVSGRGTKSPFYCMQIRHNGKRTTFSLYTSDQRAAAKKAALIFQDITGLGMAGAVKKHKHKDSSQAQDSKPEKEPAPLLGEWIEAARKAFAGEPRTFGSYAACARQIAKWIQESRPSDEPRRPLSKQEQAAAEKENRKRYSKKWAGEFRRKIDVEPVSIFTSSDVQAWRIAFVERVGNDEALRKRARISANSIMRQAKALFSKDLRDTIGGLKLPSPLPFENCKFYKGEDMSYRSKIDPAVLLKAAKNELSNSDTEVYKVLLLALGAGMRRAEIDSLTYEQINFDAKTIVMETTTEGRRKTTGSEETVPVDDALVKTLKSWRRKTRGKFVVSADGTAEAKAWGRQYRCDEVFAKALLWLRAHGVDTMKPLHTLRKEAGSLVATFADIQSAKQFLRHKSIAVTSAFYAHNKSAHTVKVGDLLQ